MPLFRMWVEGEDFGTAGERQAKLWLGYQIEHYPEEKAELERVADDAPEFLDAEELAASPHSRKEIVRK